jgi:GH25 family lysozyme M1 (1,4-beta-N-acetylmuramidase)
MATIAEKYAELQTLGFVLVPDIPLLEMPVLRADGSPTGGTFFSFVGSPGPVTIYWHPTFGAHEVYGAILTSYIAQGGPIGALGFPVSGEYDDMVGQDPVGRISDFENGSISYYFATGTVDTMLVGPITLVDSFEQVVGIDVSYAQGDIDWNRVATQGTTDGEVIGFAYIRATHDDGAVDTHFTKNWANSAGKLPRGAYHYFRAHQTPDEVRPALDTFMNTLQSAGGPGELPPMVDVESLPAGVTVSQAEQCLQFFLSLLEQAFGVRPLIYTYPSFWQHQMAKSQAFSGLYKLWIANYGPKTANGGFAPRRTAPILPGGWSEFTIWQNAVKSGVAGISTLVDRDVVLLPSATSLSDYLS